MKIICGYWALDGAPTPTGTLQAMQAARPVPAHAARQAWAAADGKLTFGSRWWSPQADLSAPACIATHPESGCAVVADARLDNPAELRAALSLPAPGDAPDSTTDHAASLILHAWLRWGEHCVDHIDGDFAFAVHDPRQRLLYLARDRMGERPLYVHHVPGKLLVFGSTAHAVLAHPWVPNEVNEARIADYLLECAGGGLEGVDFTTSFHRGIERHPPRHVLRVTAQGGQSRRYWQLEPGRAGPLPSTDQDWADALTEAMERAVAQRLAGPHRTGSMLSGGLDSTSLAIIAADQLHAAGRGPLPTFSAIDSSRPECLETAAIRTALQRPGYAPQLFDIAAPGDLQEELDRFLDEFDQPFDASMAVLDAQYANAARLGVDAVIDGANGDSLFLPSGTLRRQIRSGHWLAVWRNAQGLTRFGGRPWQHLYHPLRAAPTPDWLRQMLAPWRDRRVRQSLLDQALLTPGLAQRSDAEGRLRQMKSLRSALPLATATEAAEALMHTFPVAGAERYARVAARHGITPLAPFSERRLLELCVHLPDRHRLREGWTKPALRQAMTGRMPEPVRLRTDKQHLGWRLTRRLWDATPEHWAARLEAGRPHLAPLLDLDRLDALPSHPDSGPTQLLLGATLLGHWLGRDPGPGLRSALDARDALEPI